MKQFARFLPLPLLLLRLRVSRLNPDVKFERRDQEERQPWYRHQRQDPKEKIKRLRVMILVRRKPLKMVLDDEFVDEFLPFRGTSADTRSPHTASETTVPQNKLKIKRRSGRRPR